MYTESYSVEDINLIESNGLTIDEVDAQWKMFPDQNLDTVIGSVVGLKSGKGQERNEPFTPAEEAST